MNNFFETFGSRPVFLPVIHVTNATQALENAKIAAGSGADGVFIIDHGTVTNPDRLVKAGEVLMRHLPSLWVGLNFLDLGLGGIHFMPPGARGLWVDESGITEDGPNVSAIRFQVTQERLRWSGLYFGSIAFKYQPEVNDLAKATRAAMPFVDIITTSGKRTGEPPTVEKMRTMREAVGVHPLAIASGMSSENVEEYLPYTNCFLVATKISRSFTELDPKETREFAKRLGK
jgi:hypothetical protein